MLDNTTEELIQRVRDVTDEDNTSDVSDDLIVRCLNMGQQELVRIVSRKFKNYFMEEVILAGSSFTTDAAGNTRSAQIPTSSFTFAINSVDTRIGSSWYPVEQVPFSHTLGLDFTSGASIPLSYAVKGKSIFLYPTSRPTTEIRVRYQMRSPKLVKSQGRITDFNATNGTVTLDSVGSSLSTSVDTLGAFVNVICHLTGEIKATLQVSSINSTDKQLTFKSTSLDRDVVFGYETSAALPSDISLDDYICTGDGTCVPRLAHDLTNYLIELGIFYTKRKFGTVDNNDILMKDEITKGVFSLPFGRQYTKKIARKYRKGTYSVQSFFRGA